MNFISLIYLAFLFVLVLVYYLLPKKAQPWVLLTASLVFYFFAGWKDLVFLLALAFIGYGFGIAIGKAGEKKESDPKALRKQIRRKKIGLIFSLLFYILLLVYGKFGLALWDDLKSASGLTVSFQLLIPAGLSFLVFSGISYDVDVYRGTVPYERNPLKYLLFLTYFPKVLMGPIERYGKVMPELLGEHPATPENIGGGLLRILIGFFKKVVLAESIYPFIHHVLSAAAPDGSLVALMLLLYSFYLYLDFSGYIDIALGTSQMLGIPLTENFHHPYLSSSIGDFWRRWHITLGSFFRDYVYYPLLMSRLGKRLLSRHQKGSDHLAIVFALLITWTLMGVWHGGSLNFLIYGLYHGFFLILESLFEAPLEKRLKKRGISAQKGGYAVFRVILTFLLVTFGYVFFVTDSLKASGTLITELFTTAHPLIYFDGTLSSLGLSPFTFGIFLLGGIFLLFLDGVIRPRNQGPEPEKTFDGRKCLLAIVSLAVISLSWLLLYQTGESASQFVYFNF
jgi:alginate O-acetyltransferase complex protein AlgI